ncbi:MAG: DNA metabolism protein, partial [Oscillospiraceae bacterium]|nr:DNA metabolism protein [Oscillospiraceae bacterium]
MSWREIIYQYDGSFEGMLCCIYESYTQKERPTAIITQGKDEPCLFEIRTVMTDRAHAQRIYRSLHKISPEVGPLLR